MPSTPIGTRPTSTAARFAAGYRLEGRTVLGFISTFQPWHGAVVLARAFVALLHEHPEHRDSVRLLMIGTGPRLDEARRIIAAAGFSDAVHFTGLVAQEDGPAHLAACDILVSPHVPNADGTPFFGSPTKLFEYMAMGKGIVASDLDQIGEVLRHGETAWLVPPGDAGALAAGLDRLVQRSDAARARSAPRRGATSLAHHTWRAHVRRTLDALDARVCTPAPHDPKRLLAISWDMPPLSGPRAVQVSRTLKQLVPLGWESSVVCFGPRSPRYNQDPELAAAAARARRRHAGAGAVARRARCSSARCGASPRRSSCCRTKSGSGFAPRRARRDAAGRRASASTRWSRSRSPGRII